MSQHQVSHAPQQAAPLPAPAVESPQPIVRVMRLYKPVMHMTPPVPQMRVPSDLSDSVNMHAETDFALSNFMLLPDSFGDIYLGEKFSAYVSVVNGTNGISFSPVQLSVKLKTANSSVDLADTRVIQGKLPGHTANLKTSEFVDLVVGHVLTVVGTHSLRVMVEYADPFSAEPRVLVKNYKFNVLNPLLVNCTALDLGNKYVVQSQITNCTRALLHIEQVSILSHRDLTVVKTAVSDDFNDCCRFDSFSSLGPDEKYAESFILEKPIGFMASSLGVVEVKWSTAMGEHGFVRGEELTAPAVVSSLIAKPESASSFRRKSTSIVQLPMLSFHCLSFPETVLSGKEFEIKLRVFNDNYSSPANIELGCSNPCVTAEGGQGLLVVGRTSWSIGVLPPREFADVTVHAVAMASGLHEFGGLLITDPVTRKEYIHNSVIAKVFVYDSFPSVVESS